MINMNYKKLKEEFDKKEQEFNLQVKELQRKCKCPDHALRFSKDNSVCGRGSIYPRIDITCKICNKTRYIFQLHFTVKNRKEALKFFRQMKCKGFDRIKIEGSWETMKRKIYMD